MNIVQVHTILPQIYISTTYTNMCKVQCQAENAQPYHTTTVNKIDEESTARA